VLSGNCNTAVGTISGLGTSDLGVVWFDAHADFNAPETTTTGFTDGIGLAVAVGHCWKAMVPDRGLSEVTTNLSRFSGDSQFALIYRC
jgi:arginase family enzyme